MIAWDGAQVLRQVSNFNTLLLLLGDEFVPKRVVGLLGLFFGLKLQENVKKISENLPGRAAGWWDAPWGCFGSHLRDSAEGQVTSRLSCFARLYK